MHSSEEDVPRDESDEDVAAELTQTPVPILIPEPTISDRVLCDRNQKV